MTGIQKLLSIVGFGIVFLAFGAANISAQGEIAKLLKRMDDNNRDLKSLKSNIKMSKHNAQLDEYDLYEGEVQYLPSAVKEQISVRINWVKPVVEQLAVGKGQYILYRPRLGQAIIGKVDDAKGNAGAGGALAFMSMNRAQLKANYEVVWIGEETVNGTVQTAHIRLTPKKATSYKAADLWVDKDGMPVQAKVVERNNDSTTILLYNVDRNATVNAEVFRISTPKGTKIIQG